MPGTPGRLVSVRYELWDVFTTEPFSGNPLAVVPDARGLSDMQMQRTANEFNLSETSFVLPSGTAETTGCARPLLYPRARAADGGGIRVSEPFLHLRKRALSQAETG